MTSAQIEFRKVMAARRSVPRDSVEYTYLSRAARKLVWIERGIPVNEWRE